MALAIPAQGTRLGKDLWPRRPWLCGSSYPAGAVNIAFWGYAWQYVGAERRVLFWLAGIYVLGCAFRSFLPMIDVPRLCLHHTPVSRIFIGRSVATVAEFAFAAKWAVLLHETAPCRAGGARAHRGVKAVLAAPARSDLFHAAENALWTSPRRSPPVSSVALGVPGRAGAP
jgi:hypothetical protein